ISLPARLAGSPVHPSSVPNTAKLTPALLSSLTNALVILLARSSKLPAQPTQNSTSGNFPSAVNSAIVGTFIELLMCTLNLCIHYFNTTPTTELLNKVQ